MLYIAIAIWGIFLVRKNPIFLTGIHAIGSLALGKKVPSQILLVFKLEQKGAMLKVASVRTVLHASLHC